MQWSWDSQYLSHAFNLSHSEKTNETGTWKTDSTSTNRTERLSNSTAQIQPAADSLSLIHLWSILPYFKNINRHPWYWLFCQLRRVVIKTRHSLASEETEGDICSHASVNDLIVYCQWLIDVWTLSMNGFEKKRKEKLNCISVLIFRLNWTDFIE